MEGPMEVRMLAYFLSLLQFFPILFSIDPFWNETDEKLVCLGFDMNRVDRDIKK